MSGRFADVLAQVAEGAVAREEERELPFAAVKALREAGVTALTVPVEFGGAGASNEELFAVLVDLAAADSNLPQLLRAHFAHVEGLRLAPDRLGSAAWLRAVAAGDLFGNASHERSSAVVGELATRVTRRGDQWFLDGEKHYSTGSLFADWIAVTAQREDEDGVLQDVSVVVSSSADGVDLRDDWNGFGQRLTGSGTTRFEAVRVDPAHVLTERGDGTPTSLPAFVQLVLLASLAGIAAAVVADAAEFVRSRTRVYRHGSGGRAAQDPLVLQVVGRLAADAAATRALVLDVARALDAVHAATGDERGRAVERAELAAVQAQAVVVELTLRSTTALFDVGGASATDLGRHLDRHWRNARTLASHNPVVYQLRTIGDHLVNGADLNYFWATGQARDGAS